MTTTKTRRIYELFDGPGGPSPKSVYYSQRSKIVWQVAAVSVKQAVYLAARDVWYERPGGVGIVAKTGNASDAPWISHDGTQVKYKHYQVFKD